MLIERLSEDFAAMTAGRRRRLHAADGYAGTVVHQAGGAGAGAEAGAGDASSRAAGAWQVGRKKRFYQTGR